LKIVVTGAAGFIGSHLAEKLAGVGHEVVGIDCFTDYYSVALKEQNAADVRAAGASVLDLDLAEDPLEAAILGADAIYHSAAQPGISRTTPFEVYLRNNIVATHRLLEAAMTLRARPFFVNISTSSVYGKHATDAEDAAPKPASNYGVTKLAAEQLALSYYRDKGLPACSLRLFSVYGPRERPDKLYPKLIGCILDGKPFPLFEGSREHSRSFTYVGDIVAGLVAALEHAKDAVGEIFNIGSDVEMTTGRGIEIVEEIMGAKAKFEAVPKRAGDQLHTRANIEKARRVLGYDPKTGPEEGLRAEVEWYRAAFGRKA